MGYDFSYFNENKAGQLAATLQAARNKIYRDVLSKKSKADIVDFETQLNGIFAVKKPQSYSNFGATDAQEYVGGEFVDTIIERFEAFQLDGQSSGANDTRTTFERATLLASVNNTIQTLKMISQQMANLPANVSADRLKAILQEMGHQVSKAVNILDNDANFQRYKQDKKKERFIGANAKDVINLINYLNAFVKTMNASTDSMKAVGDAFEEWLTKAANDFIEQNSHQIIKGAQTGAESVKRGNETVSYTMTIDELSEPDREAYGVSIDNMTISYDPGSYRQGKADVVYTSRAPGLEDSFRLSAKNWSHGYGDLGSTSIDAGITRSSSISTAEAYKIAVINKVKTMDKIANDAHEFAKMALAADIAMGISQGIQGADKGGYANLLVVNTGSRIVVKDLTDIVLKVADGVQNLSGYDEPQIESIASDIYNRINSIVKKGRTDTYLGLMTSVLNKMKVTIYVSTAK